MLLTLDGAQVAAAQAAPRTRCPARSRARYAAAQAGAKGAAAPRTELSSTRGRHPLRRRPMQTTTTRLWSWVGAWGYTAAFRAADPGLPRRARRAIRAGWAAFA